MHNSSPFHNEPNEEENNSSQVIYTFSILHTHIIPKAK